MTSPSDHLPASFLQTFVDRHMQAGQVVYVHCRSTNPPKAKFLVIGYVAPTCLLFAINSRVAPFIAHDPALAACQIRVYVADYDFLDHDSYIDCANLVRMPRAELEQELTDDINRFKGELNADTRREILRVVQNAQTISVVHKQAITASL